MKIKLFILFVSVILISCSTTSQTQKLPSRYQTGKDIKYPQKDYITGFAFDKTLEKAKILARKNLIMKISSQIKAKSTVLKESYIKNQALISHTNKTKQFVEITSDFNHNELIEIVDTHNQNGKYYAFAVLNKNKFAKLLEAEMETENQNFKKLFDTALNFLNDLNLNSFNEILDDLVEKAYNYDKKLMLYSFIKDDYSIYTKHNLSKNISSLNKVYLEKLNSDWIVIGFYQKITPNDFNKLIKENPASSPWIIRNNDEFLNKISENKTLTEAVYKTLKSEKLKVSELSNSQYKILNNQISNLNDLKLNLNNIKNKIIILSDLIFKCSYDKAFYYCRTGAKVKAYNLENQKELFYFTVEGQTSKKTKSADINLNEALNKSIKKLAPFIQKELNKYLKNYKKNE